MTVDGRLLVYNDVRLSNKDMTDYRSLSMFGGDSSGYLYVNNNAISNSIHMGYNFCFQNNGTETPDPLIFSSDNGTSRVSAGFGYVSLCTGDVNTAPEEKIKVETERVTTRVKWLTLDHGPNNTDGSQSGTVLEIKGGSVDSYLFSNPAVRGTDGVFLSHNYFAWPENMNGESSSLSKKSMIGVMPGMVSIYASGIGLNPTEYLRVDDAGLISAMNGARFVGNLRGSGVSIVGSLLTTAASSPSGSDHIIMANGEGPPRWMTGVSGIESGQNDGSDFTIWRCDDSGAKVDAPLKIDNCVLRDDVVEGLARRLAQGVSLRSMNSNLIVVDFLHAVGNPKLIFDKVNVR